MNRTVNSAVAALLERVNDQSRGHCVGNVHRRIHGHGAEW
jgi:hypothetical protein